MGRVSYLSVIFILNSLLSFSQSAITQISSTNYKYYYGNLVAENTAPLLFNHPDTNVVPHPCGDWSTQGNDQVCFQPFFSPNAPDFPNFGMPGIVHVDTRKRFVLTKVMAYLQTNNLPNRADSNWLTLKAGTPFQWQDSITTFKQDGIQPFGWVTRTYSGTDTLRYFEISVMPWAPICQQLIFFGHYVDSVSITPVPYAVTSRPLTKTYSTNGTYYDGNGKMSVSKLDTNLQNNYWAFRIFAGFRYYLNSLDQFNNGGQGLGILELLTYLVAAAAGVNEYMAFAGSVSLSQVSPTQLADSAVYNTFTSNKAIDWDSGVGGRTINGIYDFNLVANNPSAYAHTAWNYKRFATIMGNYEFPMIYFGCGNEYDLRFLNAGFYSPFNEAAFLSAIVDGHCRTLSYNGESVGILNAGVPMRPISVSWANWNPNRINAHLWWDLWNRADHHWPGGDTTIMDLHLYPTTAGSQGVGLNGVGLPPEDPTWDFEGRVRWMKNTCDSLGIRWACTEFGYDDTTNCPSSSSFVKVKNRRTKADWIAREMQLLALGQPIIAAQFWMTNRGIDTYDCATFGHSGQFLFDSIIAFVPYFKPELAYWWFKTTDHFMNGLYVDGLTKVNPGSDSVYIMKYHGSVNSDSITWVIWSPTAKNASFNYTLNFDNSGSYNVINMQDGSSTGTSVASGTGSSILLTVNETPQFVVQLQSSTPSGSILKSKRRFFSN